MGSALCGDLKSTTFGVCVYMYNRDRTSHQYQAISFHFKLLKGNFSRISVCSPWKSNGDQVVNYRFVVVWKYRLTLYLPIIFQSQRTPIPIIPVSQPLSLGLYYPIPSSYINVLKVRGEIEKKGIQDNNIISSLLSLLEEKADSLNKYIFYQCNFY